MDARNLSFVVVLWLLRNAAEIARRGA